MNYITIDLHDILIILYIILIYYILHIIIIY